MMMIILNNDDNHADDDVCINVVGDNDDEAYGFTHPQDCEDAQCNDQDFR